MGQISVNQPGLNRAGSSTQTLDLTLAQANLPAWLDSFDQFTPMHAVVVFIAASVLVGLCVLARRGRDGNSATVVAKRWGAFIVAWQTLDMAYYASKLDLQVSLPLHICDLVAWLAGLSLLTGRRQFRTMVYFWGIGLSSQAFVTPTVTVGPAHAKFWLFWVVHSNIVLSGLFDVIARGYRPTWRDLRFASLVTLTYGAVVIPVNMLLKVNYGYIGDSRPGAPTVVDKLGPWPLRVLWVGVIVYSVFTILTLVWPKNWPRARTGPGADRTPPPPPISRPD